MKLPATLVDAVLAGDDTVSVSFWANGVELAVYPRDNDDPAAAARVRAWARAELERRRAAGRRCTSAPQKKAPPRGAR